MINIEFSSSVFKNQLLHPYCIYSRSKCAGSTTEIISGCLFDHFRNLHTSFQYAALTLHHFHTPLSIVCEFWWKELYCSIKTESSYEVLLVTKFPGSLQLNKTHPPYSIALTCAGCCVLPLLQILSSTEELSA